MYKKSAYENEYLYLSGETREGLQREQCMI